MSVDFSPEFTQRIEVMFYSHYNPGPTTRHTFDRDEYIIRSQQGALQHIVELKPKNSDQFDGNHFIDMVHVHRFIFHSNLSSVGGVGFFVRELVEEGTEMDQYSGQYDLQRGEYLGGTGLIEQITPSELMGR